jgi:hypothetical protein
MGERGAGRSSAAFGSAADANSSGDRARQADPQGLAVFLTAVAILIVCSLTLVTSWFFPPAAFLAAVFFVTGLLSMLGGIISAMMELRESLEQVELEGRFVFHAVEPSLSESRQDSEEIFTSTSS